MTSITLTRRQLYDQVWSTPMIQLAKAYGLSDVGLAKVCRKHNVPKPQRGFWAKLEHGHQPKKVPLPDPDDDEEVLFYYPDHFALDDPIQEVVDVEIKDDCDAIQ
jgi:hypothetical protein